jgi:hypothetical protein
LKSHIKQVWKAGRGPLFDVKDFSRDLVGIAKQNLTADDCLTSTGFIVTDDSLLCFSVDFTDHAEKEIAYRELVESAKRENARYIVTLNDAYAGKPDDARNYYPGKLADLGSEECICIIATGPQLKSWTIEVPYHRTPDGIVFGEAVEEEGGHVGFLEGWAYEERQVH